MTQELKLQYFKIASKLSGVDPEFEVGEYSCTLWKKEE